MTMLRIYDTVQRLRAVLGALAPITVVSVPNGTFGDSSKTVITFDPSATIAQRNAAAAALAAFDWSDEAQEAWDPEKANLIALATQAVTDNIAYLNIPSPSNVQVRDQVQALTQQMNKVIRRLVEL